MTVIIAITADRQIRLICVQPPTYSARASCSRDRGIGGQATASYFCEADGSRTSYSCHFADEAARFFALDRVTLHDMLSAPSLGASFSPRFLREMLVFPYQSADGGAVLAVADPTDTAARRAAEIVLRADVAIKVASAEDL